MLEIYIIGVIINLIFTGIILFIWRINKLTIPALGILILLLIDTLSWLSIIAKGLYIYNHIEDE